jgi:hypothetical protein
MGRPPELKGVLGAKFTTVQPQSIVRHRGRHLQVKRAQVTLATQGHAENRLCI